MAAVGAAAARFAAKNRGAMGMLAAVVSTILISVIAVPLGLMGLALATFSVFGIQVSAPEGSGNAGDIPGCMQVNFAAAVNGETANGSWDGEQLNNAQLVVAALVKRNAPFRAAYITMMTAMQESSLRNLEHGDAAGPDSLGLFQQRDSWGSEAERLDPEWATNAFVDALLDLNGWRDLDPWEAAHQVQVNKDAEDYRKWWEDGDAKTLVDRFLNGKDCAAYPVELPYDLTSGYGPRNSSVPGASKWHPAYDFGVACGDPVYAVRSGTVTTIHGGSANNLFITDEATGARLGYLHMEPGNELVGKGDTVEIGEQIGSVGNYGVSGGCHLDLRIFVGDDGKTEAIKSLEQSQTLSSSAPFGYVDPDDFFSLYGVDICPSDQCARQY